jgi:hypothetical protein
MKTVYRTLAYLVAAGVVWQAASIAYAFFGLGTWIEGGGVLDQAAVESPDTAFTGVGGLAAHGIGGMTVIPLLALLLLISSFFARIAGGVRWALFVVGAVAVQVVLALLARSLPMIGVLHGGWALLLFWVAWTAARRVARVESAAAPADGDRVTASAG